MRIIRYMYAGAFVLCAVGMILLAIANHDLKCRLQQLDNDSQVRLKRELEIERGRLTRDMDRTFQAERESFRDLHEQMRMLREKNG